MVETHLAKLLSLIGVTFEVASVLAAKEVWVRMNINWASGALQ